MNYISFVFYIKQSWQQELVIAALDDIGFEGFEEKQGEVIAFINEASFNEKLFREAINPLQETYDFSFSTLTVADQNWNELWEKSFQPIVIGQDIIVRASFHTPSPHVKYDIIIDPKMSFGTGHHATTSMMLQLMLEEDFNHKSVLDFGSGTGILSILAAKRNAAAVLSIDHEEWAYKNSIENFQLNSIATARALKGDATSFEGKFFDVILANINRSIIIATMQQFAVSLNNPGKLFISGFFEADEKAVTDSANQYGFTIIQKLKQDDWIALSIHH